MKKLMLNAVTIGVMCLCIFLFGNCTKENEDSPINDAIVKLDIHSISRDQETRASKDAFLAGDKISINITSGGFDTAYSSNATENQNFYRNRVATYNSGKWTLDKDVYLYDTKATVYAHYPVSTKPELYTSTQTDYLVGKQKETNVNNANPTVNIVMEHAMSLIQFKVRKADYSGSGILKSIEIANGNSKNHIVTGADWNFSTNKAVHKTGVTGSVKVEKSSGLITLGTSFPSTSIDLFVIPTLTATQTVGDIIFKLTIDDRVFSWNVPKSTEFKSGTKYSYEVTLNSVGLQMGTVTITPWTVNSSTSEQVIIY